MKNQIAVFVIGVVVLAALGLFYFQPVSVNDSVGIGYRNHVLYLPVMVALETKLFEKHGLPVKPVLFEQTKDLLLAMSSSQIDTSFGGVNLLDFLLANQRSNGTLKLLSVTQVDNNHRVTCLISRNYSSLFSLNGKRVGHVAGAFGLAWAKAPFEKESLTAEFIPLQNNLLLPSLEAGSIDAVYLIEPGCVKAESLGYYVIINEPIAAYFTDSFYLATSVVSDTASSEKKRGIIAVYDEAIDFIRANPAEAKVILANYTGLKPDLVVRLAIPQFLKSNEWSEAELRSSIQVLKLTGEIDFEINPSLFYN